MQRSARRAGEYRSERSERGTEPPLHAPGAVPILLPRSRPTARPGRARRNRSVRGGGPDPRSPRPRHGQHPPDGRTCAVEGGTSSRRTQCGVLAHAGGGGPVQGQAAGHSATQGGEAAEGPPRRPRRRRHRFAEHGRAVGAPCIPEMPTSWLGAGVRVAEPRPSTWWPSVQRGRTCLTTGAPGLQIGQLISGRGPDVFAGRSRWLTPSDREPLAAGDGLAQPLSPISDE